MQETPLPGGWVNKAVRVGDTVRRLTGPWTPAVHALFLKHLEDTGFPESSRVLGFDQQGREVLRYIEGEAAQRPWPVTLLQDSGLISLTKLLRRYHDLAASFTPPEGSVWRVGNTALRPGQIIRHGDFGPWNTIWRDDRLVGLIDWDFAEPGPAILDVAQLAWFGVPLTSDEGTVEAGFVTPPDLHARLHLICETYLGLTAAELLDAVAVLQHLDLFRLLEWGGAGIEPWAYFLGRGEQARIEADIAWLHYNRARLR